MRRFFQITLVLCSLIFVSMQAIAVEAYAKSTYVVLPFQINGPSAYSYLEKAIPPMFSSRLFWQDKFEPVSDQSQVSEKVSSVSQALATKYNADYTVWGSVTILGEDASIDVNVSQKDGKNQQFSGTSKLDSLIPALQNIADQINNQVFGRPLAKSNTSVSQQNINNAFLVNETGPDQSFLNPELRYESQGEETGRIRTQSLNYVANSFAIDDLDNDGNLEVLILSDYTLYAYNFNGEALEPKGKTDLVRTVDSLNVRVYNHSGTKLIIVNFVDPSDATAYSYVYTYNNGAFTEFAKRVPFYMNVANLPPNFKPQLIGQRGSVDKFVQGGISEVNITGNSFSLGGQVNSLIKEANIFNFAYLPGNAKSGGDKIVILDSAEHLNVYNLNGSKIAQTDERYSGTAVGVELSNAVPGLGRDTTEIGDKYYIPMRMPVTDFDKNGTYELIVNKPISTASQFFNRYRTFPQGELEALYWDGVGLNLQWKTRRIKGSIVDLMVSDIDQNSKPEIAVLVVSHPGAVSVGSRKSMILFYPLEVTQ